MIIAAKSGNEIAAMPANSCMPVSDNPPLIAVSARKGLKTNDVLKKSGRFSINWIDFTDKNLISLLSQSNNSQDKLKFLNIPYVEILGAPVLIRAQAYAICDVTKDEEVGDHDLFIASLIGVMASLDFDEYWKFEDYHPILYLGSDFRVPFSTIPQKRRIKVRS